MILRAEKLRSIFDYFLKAFVRDHFLIKAFMVNQMHLRIVGICHTKIFENNLLRQSTGSKLNLLRKIFGVLSKVAILFNQ